MSPQAESAPTRPSPALLALCAHRWALPIATRLAADRGAKFVTLERGLAVPKDSLTRTLSGLIEAGLVARAGGYGHPMRPEYTLTREGERAAAAAEAISAQLTQLGLAAGDLGRWGLPTLAVLAPAPARFSAVSRALAPVTPRALSVCLSGLTDEHLATRRVLPEPPIAAVYAVTPKAMPLARAAAAL